MKREILFRGKRIDNGDWVFGDLIHNIDCVKVRERETDINRIAKSYEVIPETVGQYTGLKDKNGMKMFEHDKLKDNKGQVGTIFYSKTAAAFLVNWKMKDGSFETDTCFYGEVIGNAFEVME